MHVRGQSSDPTGQSDIPGVVVVSSHGAGNVSSFLSEGAWFPEPGRVGELTS